MAKNNGSGCAAWLVIGFLIIAALSQCGKDDAATPTTALTNLSSQSVPERWLYVQPSSLNCRAGPTAGSASLRTLSAGESVGVVSTRGDWSQITGNVSCWAKTSYLASEKPVPAEATATLKPAKLAGSRPSVAAIKRRMIAASIESYPGNCPCPYNTARNGSRCGGRSAYNRGGGYAPLCYAGDISAADVEAWREQDE
ncbi:SH3 domain-containing protein [Brevundimonas sp. PAMC22021]|uniref:SH3 domain-containing protein n=1 Tax=Brevundimonas sp. PAMC22021 TaxID=2861285 RepID=UPI001C636144|nr:SH3 domain-containing protein [Brevundimonas sp. PAMC22021]QYF86589.1 SH3 domain-containing protein [Brevundimonas sp. PAMC22021]